MVKLFVLIFCETFALTLFKLIPAKYTVKQWR